MIDINEINMLTAYLEANRDSKVLLEPDQVDLILEIIDAYEDREDY